MTTFSVCGNRVSASDGRWWELLESPSAKPDLKRPNGSTYRVVRAISGGVRRNGEEGYYEQRHVDLCITQDILLAWLAAQ